jgi:hypothetical protein
MQFKILFALYVCHFLADYTHLSTNWMLNAKRLGTPLIPIFSHALVHSLLMFIVLLFFSNNYLQILYLSLFQLITHFLIDLCKGRMNSLFPILLDNTNRFHWIIFGLDQLLHTIVILIICFYLK